MSSLLCFRRLCLFCGEVLDGPQGLRAGDAVGRARGALKQRPERGSGRRWGLLPSTPALFLMMSPWSS